MSDRLFILGEISMSKGQTLQDPFLNALRKDRIPVSIFLVNGIKLQGQIESFDQYAVLLKNTVSQMVYKHAISTIVPVRNPRSDSLSTTGYPSSNVGTGYPMSSGTFERQSNVGFAGGNFGATNLSSGQIRGGFTRTTSGNVGFDRQSGGFERSERGNHNHQSNGFERQGNSFDRADHFAGGFDRSSFEERGFDGKNFDKGFDTKPFGKGFDDKSFDGKNFDDKDLDDEYDN